MSRDVLNLADCIADLQAPTREDIERLEEVIATQLEPVEFETIHTFAPGLYIRTVKLPAGSVLTGRVHKTEHAFFLSEGELVIATEQGVIHASPGFQCISPPGVKRAGFCLTPVICSNVHVTCETDLAKLEAMHVEPLQRIRGMH